VKINAGSLFDYLKAMRENINDHANDHPQLMNMVFQMDKIFQEEIFQYEFDIDPISGFLSMNSYQLLLNAVQQALSGHLVTVFPIIRTALESACYAYLTAHNEEMVQVWLNRHKSESALQKCRKLFSVKKASNELKSISPEMAEYVMAHYEAAIDYGAHPNKKAVFSHLSDMGEVDERSHGFELTGVYGRNSWQVNYALLVCTEAGQAIAFLLAACTEKHPLLKDRLEVFQWWMDEKNRIAEELNGEPINYTGPMYCSVKLSE